MHKILITYFSRSGNTQKVAETIFEALDGDKTLKRLDEVQSIDPFDLVFVGFPVQSHSVPYKVEVFLKNIPAGKKIALFCTHGSLTGHRLAREALEHAAILASKAKILGTYACRGKVSFDALEALSKSPEHLEWAEMAASAAGHPNEIDLAEAKVFARQIKTVALHGHY